MKPEFIEAIGQSYRYDSRTGDVEFSDGVKYSLDESLFIASEGVTGENLSALHTVKKAFDGVLITGPVKVECEDCRGKGWLYCRAYHTKAECPKCHGKGFVYEDV